MSENDLRAIAKLLRYHILTATTKAGSGHPTSSLSAVELMAGLMFGGQFRYDLTAPQNPNNDRIIFSKGHASPLFYALWLAAGRVTPDSMLTYRRFGSPLEGHPTTAFPYADAATGSLGQGLAIGVGMALNAKYLDELPYRTYVLLGDSEMSEGSQWEAIEISAHYKLDNLTGVLDVNRLGQRGPTMLGRDLRAYEQRLRAFGWETIPIDGHDLQEVVEAYRCAAEIRSRPTMIVATTVKGRGVPFIEDQNGWHGKPLNQEDLDRALEALGTVDLSVRGTIPAPAAEAPARPTARMGETGLPYKLGDKVATRKAYGMALKRIYPRFPEIVSLDGEVCNSTYAEIFRDVHPERYFEMFIAEQNMVGAAIGLARRGQIPFVSTFAAFLTRAFDQIRMSRYSNANIKFVGSHAGVSIGQDGPSQMGLEDLAMFRTILDSVVLYPCDAVSAERMVELAAAHRGIVYIRTTRGATPVVYSPNERFAIGGSKLLRRADRDQVTIVAAGITVHEALKACDELNGESICVRVIDMYSVKPLDGRTLREAARDTRAIVTVEDHYAEGGLGEAVKSELAGLAPVYSLAVAQMPLSGTPDELLDYEWISARAIASRVREILSGEERRPCASASPATTAVST